MVKRLVDLKYPPDLENVISVMYFNYRLLTKSVREARDRAAKILESSLKKHAPVGTKYIIRDDNSYTEYKSGELRDSIRLVSDRSDRIIVYAAPHARYVIEGTKRHLIVARNKKCLRFVWPGAPPEIVQKFGGNVVRFKSVMHPGTKPNPFHVKAFEEVEDRMVGEFATNMLRFIENWVR